ncbi:hypothetical protein GKR50_03215 [Providencia rustigianii]|uniref:hypothetical protein n=2 Tax=Providencia rustigianii TaxID=158850 RepID=UPI000F6B4B70|nr:hypothetical protein [Providencia rustigianii]MTC59025.1 hypothetical protein [Providencia rustigianii]VEH53427.1 Uncharacterised protein [Providencia rustigianii]
MKQINNLTPSNYIYHAGTTKSGNNQTFLQRQAFFERLQSANSTSKKFPILVKESTTQAKETRVPHFISSLKIGSLVPSNQPTQHSFTPKAKVIFGTQFNKNIDTHFINFNKSFSFFKNLSN